MPTQRQIYKIRIVRCGVDAYWYFDKIGEEFFVIKERDSTGFMKYRIICNPDYDSHHISLLDAEVI